MPKNKGKGGKNRRRGKKEDDEKRELVFRQDGQQYAQVIRMLGDSRLETFCFDGKKRLCHIPGRLRRRMWVGQGDIVLVGLRGYEDKCDLLLKYTPEEARNLKAYGELPESARVHQETDDNDDDGVRVDFETVAAGEGAEDESESESEEDSDAD